MKFKIIISQLFFVLAVIIASGCSRSSDDFLQAGRTNVIDHKYDQALSNFNYAIELDSNNAQAHLERALIANKTSNPVPLEADLSKYIELTAKSLAIAHIGRALDRMLHRTDPNASLADLNNAIAIDPSNIQGYHFKRELLSQQGDTVQLKEFLNSIDDSTRLKLFQKEKIF
ncbi:MAG: hypothetical protein NTX44_08550 [Ignavibacteriales bacterium]|nr:hypothetical protein [Ignavibacteriales bacterium]